MPRDEVVEVIPVRHRFVATTWAMLVCLRVSSAVVRRRTRRGIRRVLFYPALVHVTVVGVMQVPVMQVVQVPVVLNGNVTAVGTVDVIVVRVGDVVHRFLVGGQRSNDSLRSRLVVEVAHSMPLTPGEQVVREFVTEQQRRGRNGRIEWRTPSARLPASATVDDSLLSARRLRYPPHLGAEIGGRRRCAGRHVIVGPGSAPFIRRRTRDYSAWKRSERSE